MKNELIQFTDLLDIFPEVTLPITLTPDNQHEFSRHNDVLPELVSGKFLVPLEGPSDEYTEYVACCKIPATINFHAIVYWRASLLSYSYVLATFDQNGQFIDKKVIAGTKTEGESLVQTVATIDADWLIYVAEGRADLEREEFDATESKHYDLELLPDGTIVAS